METVPPIVGRAVLLDVAGLKGVEALALSIVGPCQGT